jgi:hypothetical protein
VKAIPTPFHESEGKDPLSPLRMERKAKTVKRLRHILTAEGREGVSQSGLVGIENE